MLRRSTQSLFKNAKLGCPRSVLFVPGSNEKALRKVAGKGLNPDVIILDLEDSVPPAKKSEARAQVVRLLKEQLFEGKRCVVRINSPRTNPEEGLQDIEALKAVQDLTCIEGVAIPKTTIEDFDIIKSSVHPELDLWAFFETPQSIIQAATICASGKYKYAVMGTNDLSADLQLPHHNHHESSSTGTAALKGATNDEDAARSIVSRLYPRLPLHYHLSTVVNAARAYGVHPIDGVFNDTSDDAGFKQEAAEGKSLAFSGKTLIHPSQIPLCHDIFSPSPSEVTWANKIVAAVRNHKQVTAEGEGKKFNPGTDDDGKFGGVIVVGGKMVEGMHYDHAVRVLQRDTHPSSPSSSRAEENK